MSTARDRLRRAFEQDRTWVALLAAAFALTLAASWHRWADPIVDVGREMNQPLRLAAGERLYSDVRHIYGPLSPYLHAALYRAFGPSLTVLYADGIITSALVLVLVFWLARQILSPAAAGAATLNVMGLCLFKPAGNYILPYSYNSLHGAALGLLTLTIVTLVVRRAYESADGRVPPIEAAASASRGRVQQHRRQILDIYAPAFVAAGLTAGLAIVAKTEMGATALATGVTAAVIVARGHARRRAVLIATFVGTAALLAASVYAVVLDQVGWRTLVTDSWLLLYNMPPELAYFNGQVSGLAHPIRSLGRMLIALAKIGIIATLVAAIATAFVSRTRPSADDRPDPDARDTRAGSQPWRLLVVAVGGVIVLAASLGLDPDKGPFLAMPFLLVGLLWNLTRRRERSARTAILITFTVFALASVARIILHVRSGGAYASYLLPMSVVLLTYLWVESLSGWFGNPRAARLNQRIVLTLILATGLVNGGVLAYRSRIRNTVPISTARGTIVLDPEMGQAFNEALTYIANHTAPGDAIAVLPEGTALTFLSSRRNPLREEIITPGYLDADGELRAIRQLRDANTALILIPNRPTREFGPAVFGRDYCQRLMRWIDAHYTPCAMFGPVKDPGLRIGDHPFFLRAYCPGNDSIETPESPDAPPHP